MPTFFGMSAQAGVPNVPRTMPTVRSMQDGFSGVFEYPYAVRGTARDANGVPLPGAIVQLFRTIDDSYVCQDTSDANGNFTLYCSQTIPHYAVAYLAGSPDVCGTTVNTLISA